MRVKIYLVNVSVVNEKVKERSIFLQFYPDEILFHNIKKLTILHGKSNFIVVNSSFKQRVSHIQNCSAASNNSTLNVDHLLTWFQNGRSATVIDESFFLLLNEDGKCCPDKQKSPMMVQPSGER